MITGILLALPWTQTKLANYLTQVLNKDFGTNLSINRIHISLFGSIEIDQILAIDHHQDTLFYIKNFKTTTLDFVEIIEGNVLAGAIEADSLFLNMKTYKGETDTNLDLFIAAFDNGQPSSGKFLMTSPEIRLKNSKFLIQDENSEVELQAGFSEIDGIAKNFKIKGSDVTSLLQNMNFIESRGLVVTDLDTDFTYTKSHIYLNELAIETPFSNLNGQVHLLYNREDFKDFNNKVVFKGFLNESKLSSNDIAVFASEIGSDINFDFKTTFQGPLNNLEFKKLQLKGINQTVFNGQITLKNSFEDDAEFAINTKFENFVTSYEDLIELLPTVLQDKLPEEFKKLGVFNMNGIAQITKNNIYTDFKNTSDLGFVDASLKISNPSDLAQAIYVGNIKTDNFQLGNLINNSKIGLLSMDIAVEGKSFEASEMDAFIKGNITKIGYNQYNYSNIRLEGNFKNPLYNGVVYVNDPNLFMDFIGLVDVSESKEKFDFDVFVDYANLKELRFMKDSISIFKGKISANFIGTEINNLEGTIALENASYQNPKDIFLFEDLNITSTFDDKKERTIKFQSTDIVEGTVVGTYQFEDLDVLFSNALGGIYKNFKPEKIKAHQSIAFDIDIYNKLIEIFYPDIEIGSNTSISGSIDGDTNDLVVDFQSPNLNVYDNKIYNLSLNLDTKNPLYLTYISVDSLKNEFYTLTDFNLINLTSRDTLFFRTEFKGGGSNGNRDQFNLNIFQTIDSANDVVVGFQKSDFTFKDYFWNVNEEENDFNRVVFDKKFQNIDFDKILLTHENQKISLDGFLNENGNKNVDLSFKNVKLGKITPDIENLTFDGDLSGFLHVEQENKIYKPTASLNIDDLTLNQTIMGNLDFDIVGDETFKVFDVDVSIENESTKTLAVEGKLNVEKNETALDLDMRLDGLNLDPFKNIGGEILTNLRGNLTGTAAIEGTVDKPIVNGRMFLNESGLKIPYLNVDYSLGKNAIIDITEKQFLFRNIPIQDTEFKTDGILKGSISHQYFSKWVMGLEINSDRLAILNTQDEFDALYFGQAFIDGKAELTGPIDELLIDITATSEQGTKIKIPINESISVGERSYIKFLSPDEKYQKDLTNNDIKANNGLELLFDLTINENAEIEVIIDRDSGHGMKGSGRGSLLMEINTNGKFNMYGDYQVYKGYYDFKYRSVISKRLDVKKYGTIIWEGDPLQAQLNLEASYIANANPSVLLQNPSFNRKVDTELLIGVRGTILNPELDFNFAFPTLSSVFNSEIQAQLNNKEIRETQAIYVLATGSFITVDSGLSQNAFSNNLYESLGGVLDKLFQDEDSKLQVGVDIVTADRTPGREANGSVGVTTSFDINERISVNGKVGVPVGGVNQSSVVGNVEVSYRLNNSGTSNLKAFNRENDINYIGEGIGFTQGVGISYEVDFSTFGELLRKIIGTKKEKSDTKTTDFIPDSDYSEEAMRLFNEKNKNQNQNGNNSNNNSKPAAIQVPELD
uniref:translocation/assembly module TamB domain-containing protein n=2 Tax=Flavobacterium sp. TaxID=239 RepID=UPI00404A7FB0